MNKEEKRLTLYVGKILKNYVSKEAEKNNESQSKTVIKMFKKFKKTIGLIKNGRNINNKKYISLYSDYTKKINKLVNKLNQKEELISSRSEMFRLAIITNILFNNYLKNLIEIYSNNKLIDDIISCPTCNSKLLIIGKHIFSSNKNP